MLYCMYPDVCCSCNFCKYWVVVKHISLFSPFPDPPTITVDPRVPIVRLGAPLSLTCTLSTVRNSSFLWRINGVSVDQTDARYIVTTTPNQSTLKISSVSLSDIGTIECIGQDPIHLPVRTEALVIETPEAYIIGGGADEERVNVQIGTRLMLRCTVRNHGAEMLNIQWFLGNRELTSGTEFRVDSNGTLTKNNVSLSNEARYLCRAEFGGTRLELTVNVRITSKSRSRERERD